jgi:hypothetical protein
MGNTDDAQFNGFEGAVVSSCPSANYLMCFFHVMLNVKKKAKHLSAPDRSLVAAIPPTAVARTCANCRSTLRKQVST